MLSSRSVFGVEDARVEDDRMVKNNTTASAIDGAAEEGLFSDTSATSAESTISSEFYLQGGSYVDDDAMSDSSEDVPVPLNTDVVAVETDDAATGWIERGISQVTLIAESEPVQFTEDCAPVPLTEECAPVPLTEVCALVALPKESGPVEHTVECAPQMTRNVSWGAIEMRLYPIIPGDHPDTWQGPPVRNSLI